MPSNPKSGGQPKRTRRRRRGRSKPGTPGGQPPAPGSNPPAPAAAGGNPPAPGGKKKKAPKQETEFNRNQILTLTAKRDNQARSANEPGHLIAISDKKDGSRPIRIIFPDNLTDDELTTPQPIEIIDRKRGSGGWEYIGRIIGDDAGWNKRQKDMAADEAERQRLEAVRTKPFEHKFKDQKGRPLDHMIVRVALKERPGGIPGEPKIFVGRAADGRDYVITSHLLLDMPTDANGVTHFDAKLDRPPAGGVEYRGRVLWEQSLVSEVNKVRHILNNWGDLLKAAREVYPDKEKNKPHPKAGQFVYDIPKRGKHDPRTQLSRDSSKLLKILADLGRANDIVVADQLLADLQTQIARLERSIAEVEPHVPDVSFPSTPITEQLADYDGIMKERREHHDALVQRELTEAQVKLATLAQEKDDIETDPALSDADRAQNLADNQRQQAVVQKRVDRLEGNLAAGPDKDEEAAIDQLLDKIGLIAAADPNAGTEPLVGGPEFAELKRRLSSLRKGKAVNIKNDPVFKAALQHSSHGIDHASGVDTYIDIKEGETLSNIRVGGGIVLFDTEKSNRERQQARPSSKKEADSFSLRCSVDQFLKLVRDGVITLDAASQQDLNFENTLLTADFKDVVRYLNREKPVAFTPLYTVEALQAADSELYDRVITGLRDRLVTEYFGVGKNQLAKVDVSFDRLQDYRSPAFRFRVVVDGQLDEVYEITGQPGPDGVAAIKTAIDAAIVEFDKSTTEAAVQQAAVDQEALDRRAGVHSKLIHGMECSVLDAAKFVPAMNLPVGDIATTFTITETDTAGEFQITIGDIQEIITLDVFLQMQRDGIMKVDSLPPESFLIARAAFKGEFVDIIKYLNGVDQDSFAAPHEYSQLRRENLDLYQRMRAATIAKFKIDYLGLDQENYDAVVVELGRPDPDDPTTITFKVSIGTELNKVLDISGDEARDGLDVLKAEIAEAIAAKKLREQVENDEAREVIPTPVIGMRGSVAGDLVRFGEILNVVMSEHPGNGFILKAGTGAELMLVIGGFEALITPEQFLELQREGIIRVETTPLQIPDRSTSKAELINLSYQIGLDPPLAPGEMLIYDGPTEFKDGKPILKKGDRIIISHLFSFKYDDPKTKTVEAIAYWADGENINHRTGEMGDPTGGIPAEFLKQWLGSDTPPMLDRMGPETAVHPDWFKQQMEAGKPIDGRRMLELLDLVSDSAPGEYICRVKFENLISRGAGVGPGGVIRIKKINDANQTIECVAEGIDGKEVDSAQRFAITYKDLLARFQSGELKRSEQGYEEPKFGLEKFYAELKNLGTEDPMTDLATFKYKWVSLVPHTVIDKKGKETTSYKEVANKIRLVSIDDHNIDLDFMLNGSSVSRTITLDEFVAQVRAGGIIAPQTRVAPDPTAAAGPAVVGVGRQQTVVGAQGPGARSGDPSRRTPDSPYRFPGVTGIKELAGKLTVSEVEGIKQEATAAVGFVGSWLYGDALESGFKKTERHINSLRIRAEIIASYKQQFQELRPFLSDRFDPGMSDLASSEHDIMNRLGQALDGISETVTKGKDDTIALFNIELIGLFAESAQLADKYNAILHTAYADYAAATRVDRQSLDWRPTSGKEFASTLTEEFGEPVTLEDIFRKVGFIYQGHKYVVSRLEGENAIIVAPDDPSFTETALPISDWYLQIRNGQIEPRYFPDGNGTGGVYSAVVEFTDDESSPAASLQPDEFTNLFNTNFNHGYTPTEIIEKVIFESTDGEPFMITKFEGDKCRTVPVSDIGRRSPQVRTEDEGTYSLAQLTVDLDEGRVSERPKLRAEDIENNMTRAELVEYLATNLGIDESTLMHVAPSDVVPVFENGDGPFSIKFADDNADAKRIILNHDGTETVVEISDFLRDILRGRGSSTVLPGRTDRIIFHSENARGKVGRALDNTFSYLERTLNSNSKNIERLTGAPAVAMAAMAALPAAIWERAFAVRDFDARWVSRLAEGDKKLWTLLGAEAIGITEADLKSGLIDFKGDKGQLVWKGGELYLQEEGVTVAQPISTHDLLHGLYVGTYQTESGKSNAPTPPRELNDEWENRWLNDHERGLLAQVRAKGFTRWSDLEAGVVDDSGVLLSLSQSDEAGTFNIEGGGQIEVSTLFQHILDEKYTLRAVTATPAPARGRGQRPPGPGFTPEPAPPRVEVNSRQDFLDELSTRLGKTIMASDLTAGNVVFEQTAAGLGTEFKISLLASDGQRVRLDGAPRASAKTQQDIMNEIVAGDVTPRWTGPENPPSPEGAFDTAWEDGLSRSAKSELAKMKAAGIVTVADLELGLLDSDGNRITISAHPTDKHKVTISSPSGQKNIFTKNLLEGINTGSYTKA